MELVQLLNAGGVAGLVAGMTEVLWSMFFANWLKNEHFVTGSTAQPTDGSSERSRFPLQILLHLLSGVGIGLLFWLSWGLAAVIRIDWVTRGLVFAAALWLICVAPTMLQLYLSQRLSFKMTLFTLLQRLYALVLIGLACAWTWARG